MKRYLLGLLSFLGAALTLGAYVRDGAPIWKDGTVQMQMRLGDAPTYTDGTVPSLMTLDAISFWNPYMGRVQLAGNRNTPGAPVEKNGLNDISFQPDMYGEAFDSETLAVTLVLYTSTQRGECDILINQKFSWDSYRGPLGTKYDIRRVLAHELGHVLGLDHPDQNSQYVTALMNSRISDYVEVPQKDDQDGVASMYGNGVANQPTPPVLNSNEPYDVTVTEGSQAYFSVYPSSGTRPLSFEWYKDGSPIAGANSSSYSILATRLTDAGLYKVVVRNGAGSVSSREARLTVNPTQAPSFGNYTATKTQVILGSSFSLSAYPSSGTPPFSFQWYKDGVVIPGATQMAYGRNKATANDGGEYALEATNAAGKAKAIVSVVTITPLPLPYTNSSIGTRSPAVGQNFSLASDIWDPDNSLTCQWYKDGVRIPSAISKTLYFSPLSYKDAGEYCVVIQNATGPFVSGTVKVDPVPSTSVVPGSWVGTARSGNNVYFAFENPARIERYDLASNAWLEPVYLKTSPTAIAADGTYVCVGTNKEFHRFNRDLTGDTLLYTIGGTYPITGIGLCSDSAVLYHGVSYSSEPLTVVSVSDGRLLAETSSTYYGSKDFAPAPGLNKVFTHTTGISPADIVEVQLATNGSIVSIKDSPYHGTFPAASRIFMSPDQMWVADDSGTVYSTADLSYLGFITGNIRDMDFDAAGKPVVLTAAGIHRWEGYRYKASAIDLNGFEASKICVSGDDVVAFAQPPVGGSIQVKRFGLSTAIAPSPAPAVDPVGLQIIPTSSFVGSDGMLYILSKINRHIFRWNPETKAFQPPHIPLFGMPNVAVYSANQNRIYLSYTDGRITQVRLDAGESKETPFASVPVNGFSLAVLGDYLVSTDPSSMRSFGKAGTEISAVRGYASAYSELIPNPALRTVYTLFSRTSTPNVDRVDMSSTGALQIPSTSGMFSAKYPLRVSPDGNTLLAGDGIFINPITRQPTNSLGTEIDDAVWSNAQLFIGKNTLSGFQLERRAGYNYAADRSFSDQGTLLRLLPLKDKGLVALKWQASNLSLTTLDEDLNSTGSNTIQPPSSLLGLSTRAYVGTGDNVLIPAFVISGSAKKNILIRAVGPTLAESNVSGCLSDPQIELYKVGLSSAIAANDNWSSAENLAALQEQLLRFYGKLLPSNSRDAAMLVSLDPGAYTVVTSGVKGATGVALVEVYDADIDRSQSKLTALAVRCRTENGDNVPIAGLTIDGSRAKRVIIQGIGPTLGNAVPGHAPNPRLRIFSGSDVIDENKDWGNSAEVLEAETEAGASKLDASSKDAAFVSTLSPGAYTAIIDDETGASGVALIEVYEIPEK